MGFQILSESYGRRLPKITAEADSADDLTALGTSYAEGSTCTVGEDEYVLDKVGGWVIPGSGGGGGGALIVTVTKPSADVYRMDKTAMEIYDAMSTGKAVVVKFPDSQFYDNQVSTVIAMNRDAAESQDQAYAVQVWFEGNITPFAANEASNWYPFVDFS